MGASNSSENYDKSQELDIYCVFVYEDGNGNFHIIINSVGDICFMIFKEVSLDDNVPDIERTFEFFFSNNTSNEDYPGRDSKYGPLTNKNSLTPMQYEPLMSEFFESDSKYDEVNVKINNETNNLITRNIIYKEKVDANTEVLVVKVSSLRQLQQAILLANNIDKPKQILDVIKDSQVDIAIWLKEKVDTAKEKKIVLPKSLFIPTLPDARLETSGAPKRTNKKIEKLQLDFFDPIVLRAEHKWYSQKISSKSPPARKDITDTELTMLKNLTVRTSKVEIDTLSPLKRNLKRLEKYASKRNLLKLIVGGGLAAGAGVLAYNKRDVISTFLSGMVNRGEYILDTSGSVDGSLARVEAMVKNMKCSESEKREVLDQLKYSRKQINSIAKNTEKNILPIPKLLTQ